jgi:REP element-mobilizing transposase RayT
MPRKARIDAAGALHHIIVRGIKRRKIFWDDADRDSFVNRVGQVLIETQTDCFAWAMIFNHVHLFFWSRGLAKQALINDAFIPC